MINNKRYKLTTHNNADLPLFPDTSTINERELNKYKII